MLVRRAQARARTPQILARPSPRERRQAGSRAGDGRAVKLDLGAPHDPEPYGTRIPQSLTAVLPLQRGAVRLRSAVFLEPSGSPGNPQLRARRHANRPSHPFAQTGERRLSAHPVEHCSATREWSQRIGIPAIPHGLLLAIVGSDKEVTSKGAAVPKPKADAATGVSTLPGQAPGSQAALSTARKKTPRSMLVRG